MLLIRPRVIVVIALAVLVFSATASVLVGLKAAPGAFVLDEGFVVTSGSAPTMFSSQVDLALADALSTLDNVTAVHPEVLAFSVYEGQSFVVRGVESMSWHLPDDWAWPLGPANPAYVGSGLRERLGLEPPCFLPLVGSYTDRVAFVQVLSSPEYDSPLDDELIVPIDVARHLVGMGQDKVSIIRVETDEPGWLSDLLSPGRARFMVSDLTASRLVLTAGEEFSASVKLTNWGTVSGEATVTFYESGAVLASAEATVGASSSETVSATLSFDSLGEHEIVARVSGDLPVSLSLNVTVVEPYLVLTAPSRVVLGSELHAKVSDHSGNAVQGATVTFGSEVAATDSEGAVSFEAAVAGTVGLVAEYSGLLPAQSSVQVLDPADYPAEPLPTVTSLSVSPALVSEGGSSTGTVMVENLGSVGASSVVHVTVDGSPYADLELYLGPMEAKAITFVLEGLDPGTYTVQAGTFSAEVTVEAWYSDDLDLVQLVLKYGGTAKLSSAGSVPIYQAAKLSEGNIAVALFSIGAVSALMSTIAVTSVFSKEVREGRRKLGILRTVGASRSDIRRLVTLQALALGFVGSALGVVFGAMLALGISESGMLFVFGHRLSLPIDGPLLLMVFTGAVMISVSSALASAEIAVRSTAISSIKKLPEEAPHQPDVSELLGED